MFDYNKLWYSIIFRVLIWISSIYLFLWYWSFRFFKFIIFVIKGLAGITVTWLVDNLWMILHITIFNITTIFLISWFCFTLIRFILIYWFVGFNQSFNFFLIFVNILIEITVSITIWKWWRANRLTNWFCITYICYLLLLIFKTTWQALSWSYCYLSILHCLLSWNNLSFLIITNLIIITSLSVLFDLTCLIFNRLRS